MARSLKNLHNTQSNGNASAQSTGNSTTFNENNQGDNSINQSAQRYMGMNEGQLMNELFSKANQDGVSASELEDFYKKMSPYLSHEQRNKMRQLINMLKK